MELRLGIGYQLSAIGYRLFDLAGMVCEGLRTLLVDR